MITPNDVPQEITRDYFNPFYATGLFLKPPENTRNHIFWYFLGEVERDQWQDMGLKNHCGEEVF